MAGTARPRWRGVATGLAGLLLACGAKAVRPPALPGETGSALLQGFSATRLEPRAALLAPGTVQAFRAEGAEALAWSVDGVEGGSAAVGTVRAQAGKVSYKAPLEPGSHLLVGIGAGQALRAVVTVLTPCGPEQAAPEQASPGVDVRAPAFGARGDGLADDTEAIQKAIRAVAGTGGTVRVPGGTYLVDATRNGGRGLLLASRMTLALAPGAVLKAIPNGAGSYAIVSVVGASDVAVTGGTLLGERGAHQGSDGEWGMGMWIQDSARVTVTRVQARECWGDGFYVSGHSSQVTFCGVLAGHNRRNGLSATGCDGLVVRASEFRDSRGTAPEDGLDIEPNASEAVRHALVSGCLFSGNAGGGLETGVGDADVGQAVSDQVVVERCGFSDNGQDPAGGALKAAIRVSNCPATRVTANVVAGNAGQGIYLRRKAEQCVVADNLVSLNGDDGILLEACADNRIQGNRVQRNGGHGIYSRRCSGIEVSGNSVAGNRLPP